MREILFRVWHKAERKFIKPEFSGDLCVGDEVIIVRDFKPNNNGGYSVYRTRVFLRSDVEVMQYTGLKDKHGKKIFERDNVVIIHPCWTNKASVEFNNGSFIFRSFDTDTQDVIIPGYTFMTEKWQVEIIGNIYE